MPKATGKKKNIENKNIDPSDVSPVIGLGKKATKRVLEKSPESTVDLLSEMGVNQMVESCFKGVHNNIQAKKRRMEQFVSNALASSNAKLAHCSTQADKGQNELREFMPMQSKDESTSMSKIIEGGVDFENTLHQIKTNNESRGFDRNLCNVIEGFLKRVEGFVEVITKQETEQRDQIPKMQQQLKKEIGLLEKKMMKNEMSVLQNINLL